MHYTHISNKQTAIIEAIRARNLPAVITFIDFIKAFDSIKRREMFHILKDFGIPTRLMDAIGKIYEEKLATVLCPDGETEFFKIMLQGDTLAPYLFIMSFFLEYVLREAIEGHEESLGITIKPRPVSYTHLTLPTNREV